MTLEVMGLRMTPETRRKFERWAAGVDATAVISNNLPYILALEYGHSRQAAYGFIRIYKSDFRRMVDEELQEALYRTRYDFPKAYREGITLAALRILGEIAKRTPVDTGRAKGAWIVTLPDGSVRREAREVSADQQKSRARANRKAKARRTRSSSRELAKFVRVESPDENARAKARARRDRRQKRRGR